MAGEDLPQRGLPTLRLVMPPHAPSRFCRRTPPPDHDVEEFQRRGEGLSRSRVSLAPRRSWSRRRCLQDVGRVYQDDEQRLRHDASAWCGLGYEIHEGVGLGHGVNERRRDIRGHDRRPLRERHAHLLAYLVVPIPRGATADRAAGCKPHIPAYPLMSRVTTVLRPLNRKVAVEDLDASHVISVSVCAYECSEPTSLSRKVAEDAVLVIARNVAVDHEIVAIPTLDECHIPHVSTSWARRGLPRQRIGDSMSQRETT